MWWQTEVYVIFSKQPLITCCWPACNIRGGNWFGNIAPNHEHIEINDVNGGNNVNASYIFNSLTMRIEILMSWFIWSHWSSTPSVWKGFYVKMWREKKHKGNTWWGREHGMSCPGLSILLMRLFESSILIPVYR